MTCILTSRGGARNEAFGTGATRSLVSDAAKGVRTARISCARIRTFIPQAHFTRRAIFVRVATEYAHVVEADVAEEAVVVDAASDCEK